MKRKLAINDYEERLELRIKQKQEREALRNEQEKRRQLEQIKTGAGGRRAGAGSKVTIPHKEYIVNGVDVNKKKVYSFYLALDERDKVKNFIKVWREIRFNTAEASHKLERLGGLLVYKLLTGEILTEQEREAVKKYFPSLE